MSLPGDFRNRSRWTAFGRVLLASLVLFAIFAARGVAPDFTRALNSHSLVVADSHHDQRPRFDDSGYRWSEPAAAFELLVPTAKLAGLILAPKVFSPIQTKGFHFNRPPPIS
jgi:hypothetical protein